MKTKIFALIVLMLLPLGMAAQSDPVEARLKAKYDDATRYGKGTSTAPFYYIVKRNRKVGGCDANGREIIPPRYDVISFGREYWLAYLDGKMGAFDVNGREIIPPLYYKSVIKLGDGTSTRPFYYQVSRDGKEGACDANGKEIIPPVYDYVSYYNGRFKVDVNGESFSLDVGLNPDGTARGTYKPLSTIEARLRAKYDSVSLEGEGTRTNPYWYWVEQHFKFGACDETGREIIPPGVYDAVRRNGNGTSIDPFRYWIYRDGKCGMCDMNGREIIPPVYDQVEYSDDVFQAKINGEWVSLGIGLNPDGTAKGTYTPAPGYGANSASKLLYKGTYTRSGEAYMVEEKRWVGMDEDVAVEVEIYNDHVNMIGYRFEFDHIDSDNHSVIYLYEDEREPDAIVFRRCLMNPDNYDLTYEVFIMRLNLSFNTFRFKMAKGAVKMPKHKK